MDYTLPSLNSLQPFPEFRIVFSFIKKLFLKRYVEASNDSEINKEKYEEKITVSLKSIYNFKQSIIQLSRQMFIYNLYYITLYYIIIIILYVIYLYTYIFELYFICDSISVFSNILLIRR